MHKFSAGQYEFSFSKYALGVVLMARIYLNDFTDLKRLPEIILACYGTFDVSRFPGSLIRHFKFGLFYLFQTHQLVRLTAEFGYDYFAQVYNRIEGS